MDATRLAQVGKSVYLVPGPASGYQQLVSGYQKPVPGYQDQLPDTRNRFLDTRDQLLDTGNHKNMLGYPIQGRVILNPSSYCSTRDWETPNLWVQGLRKTQVETLNAAALEKIIICWREHHFGPELASYWSYGRTETGKLQEIALRTLWEGSQGPRPLKPARKIKNLLNRSWAQLT